MLFIYIKKRGLNFKHLTFVAEFFTVKMSEFVYGVQNVIRKKGRYLKLKTQR